MTHIWLFRTRPHPELSRSIHPFSQAHHGGCLPCVDIPCNAGVLSATLPVEWWLLPDIVPVGSLGTDGIHRCVLECGVVLVDARVPVLLADEYRH